MSPLATTAVDVRRFNWRLAPVQRKLEWESDAAKARLLQLLQEVQRAAAKVTELEAARAEEAAAAARLMRARGDTRAYGQALVYLSMLARHEAEASREHLMAAELADAARAEGLACQRRLATLIAARDHALAEHVRQELQREGKEADAAWLMMRAGRHQPAQDEPGGDA